ncbi:hypothetical protein DHEL01_v207770 [Diaporthe helianthi]|uniref:Uncharacterized protein n=1 Tax=Diaporthe helianthi TaxID=158607 RepID=A0A2P5HUA7_DIAHE|nr:hypothetical protein DHEL01_v207770 [Diaporthe helianthi]
MATHTQTPQNNEVQPEQRVLIGFKISPVVVPGTDGERLYDVEVASFVDKKCVGLCRAKLIKESEYHSRTKHFFSAMDDQSNTMGDLAQLVLWSEGRWVFNGPWDGMKEYGDRNPVREKLDKDLREHLGRIVDPEWLLLFTKIGSVRFRNIDRAMVRKALDRTLSLARAVRRPLLAAVEPGCVKLERFYIRDRSKFEELYGSNEKHWPVIQSVKARQEKFWLEMGFQKFEKPKLNRDLSNFFFWSGHFELPESKDIYLIVSEKTDPRLVRPKRDKIPNSRPQKPEEPDKTGAGGKAVAEKRPEKRHRTEDGGDEPDAADQRPEKRYRLVDDMTEMDPVELPQRSEATNQIGGGDVSDSINWADYD